MLLVVLVGGAIGAPARYLTDLAVGARTSGGGLPWGTFVVNVVGSGLAGLVVGHQTATAGPGWLTGLLGTGFCGALTTFSTFGVQTVRLVEQGRPRVAAANVLLSIGAGLLTCSAGQLVGAALGG
jgi:fluoride exporter